MNEADRKAFEEYRDKRNEQLRKEGRDASSKWYVTNVHYSAWQAACEWRDSQDRTSQINQQLVDALQFIIDCQESTNGSDYESGSALREAAQIARAALAATQMRGDA